MKYFLALAVAMAPAALVAQPDDSNTRESKIALSFDAEVHKVSDGDTVTLVSPTGAKFRIRMSDIDTPETEHAAFTPRSCRCNPIPFRPGQPGGQRATVVLQALVEPGDKVKADCYEIDDYGRMVCHVFKGDVNLNLEMIKSGWGWLPSNEKWVRDPASAPAQQEAKQQKLGAWGLDDQISPRQWRVQCWRQGQCAGSPSTIPEEAPKEEDAIDP